MISWWAPARAHRLFSKLLHICLVSTRQFTLKCTWLFVWKRHLLLCLSGRFIYVKCGRLSWYAHDIFRPRENCFSHWLILNYSSRVWKTCFSRLFIYFCMNLALHLQHDANIAILMQDSITTKFAANNFNCMPSTQHMCDSITLFQTKKKVKGKRRWKKNQKPAFPKFSAE